MNPETQKPAVFILVAYNPYAGSVKPEDMAKLTGRHFESIADMTNSAEEALGRFDETGWNIFPAAYYCELRNEAAAKNQIPDQVFITYMTCSEG